MSYLNNPSHPDNVLRVLRSLEAQHGIRVLHAVEGGSRAWGYSNENSDVDIRFIYCQLPWARPIDSKLDTIRQSFECFDVPFDVLGFEWRKAVQKLTASDMTTLEIIFSPMRYGSIREFVEVAPVARHYFNPHTLYQAARDQAKRHLYIEQIGRSGEQLTAKSLLLSLRFSLIAMTIAVHDEMEFNVQKLIALNEARVTWARDAFIWLSENRDYPKGELISHPLAAKILELFHVVESLPKPEGKRERDLLEAQGLYGQICRTTLATYHVTNATDLVI